MLVCLSSPQDDETPYASTKPVEPTVEQVEPTSEPLMSSEAGLCVSNLVTNL